MIAEALAFASAASAALAAIELRPHGRRRGRRQARPVGRIRSSVAGCAVGLLAGVILPGRLGLLAAVVAPVLGFFVPDVWRARRRAEFVAEVRRDMPALLDLLGVAVEAGLSLPQALVEVGRRSQAPLARSWGGVGAQVAVGVPLADALDEHRRELRLPEIDSFAGALARAARHGAPLAETLAAQAREVRLTRRRAIQEQAARAAPKMQLVVALLLVPSVMLLIAAALLSALTGEAGTSLTGS